MDDSGILKGIGVLYHGLDGLMLERWQLCC